METSPLTPPTSTSPKWGPNAKLIVGLSFVVILAALLFYFRNIVGPLLLAFILTYLFHPMAARVSNFTKLSWRVSVTIIYLLLVIVLITSITLTGLGAVQQIQNLIGLVQGFINDLPNTIENLSARVYTIGPYHINLTQQFDLTKLSQDVLGYLQPLLGRAGDLVKTLVTGGASLLGWVVFVLLISYFILVDASRVPEELLYIEIPGYDADVRRLGKELRGTWNAFLRGQLIIFLLVVISYTILMAALGVRYFYAIALLAGLARFVPYIGPFTTWGVTGLVTIFQGYNYFNLQPWQYTLLVIGLAILMDQVFDSLVSPRLMGQTLGVHPAAVLVAAIIAANLIGIVGLVLAAPTLATVTLLGRYTLRKMLDLDPFPPSEEPKGSKDQMIQVRLWRRFKAWLRKIRQKEK